MEKARSLTIKNILVVTESYSLGGLETRLSSKIKFLSEKGLNVYLAIGRNHAEENIPYTNCIKVYKNFDFVSEITAGEVVSLMSQLLTIIKENNIQIVEAHPFNSILPAYLAAFDAKIPFVLTLHGPSSFLEGNGQLVNWYMKEVILKEASMVQCVSVEVQNLLQSHVDGVKSCVIPNGVDKSFFVEAVDPKSDFIKCCLVSRLDCAKVEGIKSFLNYAVHTQIEVIDIYGDGPSYGELKEWVQINMHSMSLAVELKGACFNMEHAYSNYAIIAGMGRVALEGLGLNKPVILVGYDGVKGLINKENVDQVSFSNFSGRGFANISIDDLKQQINNLSIDKSQYCLSDWAHTNANAELIWKSYIEIVENIECSYSDLASKFYHIIKEHKSEYAYTNDIELTSKVLSLTD